MADCCANLDHIAQHCGGNSPGIATTIYLQCKDDITAIGEATNNVVSTLTGDFFSWSISKFEQSYVGEPEGDDDSLSFNHTLTVFVPRMTPAKTAVLNSILGGEMIAVFTDRNGETYILGDLDEGATVRSSPQTNEKNGYVVTISWQTNRMLYNYDGSISEEVGA
jgi:hypothetical protein